MGRQHAWLCSNKGLYGLEALPLEGCSQHQHASSTRELIQCAYHNGFLQVERAEAASEEVQRAKEEAARVISDSMLQQEGAMRQAQQALQEAAQARQQLQQAQQAQASAEQQQ